jgi:hypothetical protein
MVLFDVLDAPLGVNGILVPLMAYRRERHAFDWPVGWTYEHHLPGVLAFLVAYISVPLDHSTEG